MTGARDEEVTTRTLDDKRRLPIKALARGLRETEAAQLVEADRAPDGALTAIAPFQNKGLRAEFEPA